MGSSLALESAERPQAFADRCAKARAGRGVVRILHFGDSHLAGEGSSQPFSHFFHTQYGDGGPGLGLPWVSPQPQVTAHATPGWRKSRKAGGDKRMGLGAGYLETWRAGEVAALEGKFSRFRIYLLDDAAGGKVAVTVDGHPQGELDLLGPSGQMAMLARDLPPGLGSRRMEIRTTRGGLVRILGVALEGASGAIYSPLAFNGARLSWTRAIPDGLFQAQMKAEAPDLVILAFGTNEANEPEFSPDQYRRELDATLARFEQAAPRAALLLVGPPDGQLRQGTSGSLSSVIAIQKAAAEARGGLFVDQREAMGGPGSMESWFRQGWANRDRVHLSATGYQRLSGLVLAGLFAGTSQGGPGPKVAESVPESHTLFTFRKPDGGILITDDPGKVQGQPGEWVRVMP
jgi:lysophospholipase L1-like esterase